MLEITDPRSFAILPTGVIVAAVDRRPPTLPPVQLTKSMTPEMSFSTLSHGLELRNER